MDTRKTEYRVPFGLNEKFRANDFAIEVIIATVLFTLALAIRLPNLILIPPYVDEGLEVLWALDIAHGKHLPLTGDGGYYGPLFAYLIALGFYVFGVSVELPRMMVAMFGAGTVVAVYVLARVMRDRVAGLVGAGFALTSPMLVVLSSHEGWSASLTPLFATVTALALYVGVSRNQKSWLAASGLFAALTAQTHPTSVLALLGMLMWFLWQPQLIQRLRQPAPYAALALFALGYAPMFLAMLRSGGSLLQPTYQIDYALAPTLDPAEYARRLAYLLKASGGSISGWLGQPTVLTGAQAIGIGLALPAGFVWAWRRDHRLIPLIFLATLGLLPIFVVNKAYRYHSSIVPLAYALLGIFSARMLRARAADFLNLTRQRAAQALALTFLLLFMLGSLVTLLNSSREAFLSGQTNEGYIQLSQIIRARGACGAHLYLEQRMKSPTSLRELAGLFALDNAHYTLTLDRCDHVVASRAELGELRSTPSEIWLVVLAEHAHELSSPNLQEVMTVSTSHFGSTAVPLALYRLQIMR